MTCHASWAADAGADADAAAVVDALRWRLVAHSAPTRLSQPRALRADYIHSARQHSLRR